MAKSYRQGPEAEFWADPTADPARLVLYLGLWPHNTDPLCIAARRLIARDHGIDLSAPAATGVTLDPPVDDAPLFAEADDAH